MSRSSGFLNESLAGLTRTGLGRSVLALGVAGAIILGCGVGGGGTSPEAQTATKQIETALVDYRREHGLVHTTRKSELRLFTKAYEFVKEEYVRPVDMPILVAAATESMKETYPDPSQVDNVELIEAAIQGMLHDLDDYSAYYDRKAFRELRQETKGTFEGLGIEIKKDPEGLRVISPIDGTPAKRAGLRPGDRLTHADGQSLAELSLRASVELLRGRAGSTILVRIARGDLEPFDVPITREKIRIQPVKARMEGDVAVLRVTQFVDRTGKELHDAMARLDVESKGQVRGYVLDLRRNPGGLLTESVDVASNFLDGGVVVSTRGRRENSTMRADGGDPSRNLPIVVLIDRGSASASEIVAGALKDRGRAVIMGEKSFGKGSVQTILPLSDARGMKLTTALYFTPGNFTVEGGIKPDIDALDDPDTEPDEALETALKLVIDMAGGHSVYWGAGTVKR